MRGAKSFQELTVWQLADQIRVLVFKLTERDCFVRDLKLHSQTEDAVNSMCRNIAEGFACRHKEFARFLEISRRSLNELCDAFRSAQLKRYVTPSEYEPIWRLTHRLYPAYAEFIHYLRTTPDPDPPPARPRPRTNRTDPAKRDCTNPKPTCTNPKPARTNPAKHDCTDPKPARTDPAKHDSTDPDPTNVARR